MKLQKRIKIIIKMRGDVNEDESGNLEEVEDHDAMRTKGIRSL